MSQEAERTKTKAKLWTLHYSDFNASVFLKTYADTVVFDSIDGKRILIAVRFGGYAEQVRGMADAVYGGGLVDVSVENGKSMPLTSLVKQYKRLIANDGLYTEATLLIQDDRVETDEPNENGTDESSNDGKQAAEKKDLPRTSYIFSEQDNMDRLFEEIDKKVSVPLIPAFKDYVITEMQNRHILKKLTVISIREKFDAWKIMLTPGEKNVIQLIEDGLKSGAIVIPNTNVAVNNPFAKINTVSNYLDAFGVMIAEKIKGQFNPLFDPVTEKLSREILTVNSNIKRKAGYSLYAAQLAEAESMKPKVGQK